MHAPLAHPWTTEMPVAVAMMSDLGAVLKSRMGADH
jgi:hypothetical protein